MGGPVARDGSGPDPAHARPRVKICGLTRAEDAAVAVEAGASYLGVILSPGFSRSVDPERASAFGGGSGAVRVAVVVDAGVEATARAARSAAAGVVQLHGEETPEEVEALRALGPWRIWKALRVREADEVVRSLERYGDVVDALLLDGWHRGRGGGVGVRFPWEVVAGVRDRFPAGLELVAAGGLTPENVAEAVAALRPHVVDVSSGVESAPGIKDPVRVRAFVGNAVGARGS